MLSDSNFVCIYRFPMSATYPDQLILLDSITLITFHEECKIWGSSVARWLGDAHQPLTVMTNSMEQSSSCEADSYSASQKFPHLLWNPKVHYLVHKNPPLIPVVRHINSVHTLPTLYLFKIYSNIILHLRLYHPSSRFLSGFPTRILYGFIISPVRITCPVHLILLDVIT
jgi:hypothetical protein